MIKKEYEKPVVETEAAFETLSGCARANPADFQCTLSQGLDVG
jgi:hypothetical protein